MKTKKDEQLNDGEMWREASIEVETSEGRDKALESSIMVSKRAFVVRYITRRSGKLRVIDEREEERFSAALRYGIEHQATLLELADMCCLSLSTFKRRFRERLDTSPHEWFIEQRMKLAQRIIDEMEISTNELARICCFTNTSHFITVFKRYYNTTPGKLRRIRGQRINTEVGN